MFVHPYLNAVSRTIRDLKDICKEQNLSFEKIFEQSKSIFQKSKDYSMLDSMIAVREMILAGNILEEWKVK